MKNPMHLAATYYENWSYTRTPKTFRTGSPFPSIQFVTTISSFTTTAREFILLWASAQEISWKTRRLGITAGAQCPHDGSRRRRQVHNYKRRNIETTVNLIFPCHPPTPYLKPSSTPVNNPNYLRDYYKVRRIFRERFSSLPVLLLSYFRKWSRKNIILPQSIQIPSRSVEDVVHPIRI